MELSIGTLIKIILALVVIVAVVYGVYKAINGTLFDTLKNWGVGNSTKLILSFLK